MFISFCKQPLSAYFEPSDILRAGDTTLKKKDRGPGKEEACM